MFGTLMHVCMCMCAADFNGQSIVNGCPTEVWVDT